MATSNQKIVYTLTVNGVEKNITGAKKLSEEVNNAGDAFVETGDEATKSLGVINDNLSQTNTEVTTVGDVSGKSFEKMKDSTDGASQSVNNLNNQIPNVSANVKTLGENLDNSTDGAEKGFKGLSDILKLFGVDVSVLQDVKEGLGGIGDLLKSQEKLKDVAFGGDSIKKDAQAVKELSNETSTLTNTTGGLTNATGGATKAQQLFNIAVKAFPYIIVIAAVTAIISAYQKWKQSAIDTQESVLASIDAISARTELLNEDLSKSIDEINRKADANLINSNELIKNLEKEIELLEAQGASIDVISNKRKEIVKAQQKAQEDEIKRLDAIQARQTSTLETTKKNLEEAQKSLQIFNNLEIKDVDTANRRAQASEAVRNLSKEQQEIEDKISETGLKILQTQSELNVSRKFDLSILKANTDEQREQLKLARAQALINLSANIEAANKKAKELENNFKKLSNQLSFDLSNKEIELSLNSNGFKDALKTLKQQFEDFNEDVKNSAAGIQESLSEPLKQEVEVIKNSNTQIIGSLRKDFGDLFNDDIGKQFLNNLEFVQKKIDEFKNQNPGKDVFPFIEKLRSELGKDLKLGQIPADQVNQLNTSIDQYLDNLSKIETANQKISNVGSNTDIFDKATLDVLGEAFKQLQTIVNKSLDGVSKDLKNTDTDVTNTLDDINDKVKDKGNLSISLLFDAEKTGDDLKRGIDRKTDEAVASLEESKKQIQPIIDSLFAINPKAAAIFQKMVDENLIPSLDKAKTEVKETGEAMKDEVDSNWTKIFDAFKDNLLEIGQRVLDLGAALNELSAVRTENLIKQIEEEGELRDEEFNRNIERYQEEADLQSQIAQDAASKIDQLESQLSGARGNRAAFLLRLLNQEQEREKKATKAKLDALKKEEQAKIEQQEAEKNRAAEIDSLKKKQFEKDKKLKSAEIVMATAKAIATDSEVLDPVTAALLIAADVAIGLAQLAVVNSANYEDGGIFNPTGKITGPAHSDNGMPVINPKTGKKVAELEGEEFITNKQSTKNNLPILEKINKEGKNKTFKLESLTEVTNTNTNNQSNDGRALVNSPVPIFEDGGFFSKIPSVASPSNVNQTLTSQKFVDFESLQNILFANSNTPSPNTQFADVQPVADAIRQGLESATLEVSIVDLLSRKAILDQSNALGRI